MKLITVIVLLSFNLIQTIDSKKNRISFDDEIFSYGLDKNVSPYNEMFTYDNLTYEQIDDDLIDLGGYLEFVKSLDPKLPIIMDLRTQYYENGIWNEASIRLTEKDMCPEFLNPSRFWYNVTKLWTNCPPQIGYKWRIENQLLNMEVELPANLPSTPWKWFFLFFQGLPGYEINKFGFALQLEFVLL